MTNKSAFTKIAASLLACLAISAHALEEVPFITSPDNVTKEMLRIANVGPQDFVLDLGSGDGRIVITAAKLHGARGMGVEIDPTLVERSRANAKLAGVESRAEFRDQDLFKTDLTQASVITMYLLTEVNLALRPALLELKPGTRLVSHDWDMGDWKPDQTTVLDVPDKKIGREKKSSVHLWVVPAKVQGLWCGAGAMRGVSMNMDQRYQEVKIKLRAMGRERDYQGKITGSVANVPTSGGDTAMSFELQGDRLRIVAARESLAMLKDGVLTRAVGGACGA